MEDAPHVTPRQIWANPTTTSTKTYSSGCTPFVLPSNGVIHVNNSYAFTLTDNAVYEPVCTGDPMDYTHVSAVLDTRDPFYSSVTPQLYAIGCATVVSYVLVIILLITPRTFFIGGPGGGANFLGRHGMISGSYSGNSSVVGVGGRPWLQKVAAILVAISLTIATVDSFKVADLQYTYGYSDAEALSEEVIDGTEIRIVRVISSTFLWLAQVQTLIRLFPRHKEKVMIKWAGFALIVLDTTFSVLENFYVKNTSPRPRLYDDAIPALSYLFELALNLLYAAWVIFYSISKHRYAFFHPKMRNICFVALLSLCAILIPVVFFVMDIARPEIAGWGTYIRWVGSAAASVVVWEWVERIEALERDETKDGILGREVFDGDEMLEVTPSEEVDWPRYAPRNDKGGGSGAASGWGGHDRIGSSSSPNSRWHPWNPESGRPSQTPRNPNNPQPTPPPATTTPVSRTDTTSAASTVYNVHYHPVASPTPPVAMPQMEEEEEFEEDKEIEIEGDWAPDVENNLPPEEAREQSPHIAPPIRAGAISSIISNEDAHPFPEKWPSLKPSKKQYQEAKATHPMKAQMHKPRRHESTTPFSSAKGSPAPASKFPTHPYPSPSSLPDAAASTPGLSQNHLLEPSTPHEPQPQPQAQPQLRPGRSDLPVRVIPSQPQASAPWTDADMEHGGNYVLRYDPETAELIDEDVSQIRDRALPGDHLSWTESTTSERNDAGRAQDAQHRPGHGNESS
ncbi:hypothetical protein N7526_009479 [Penicillium atrosanguineum]|nr:hypothetical protein N7526_009479 [Penicillium atrosanguineum]